MSQTNTDHLFGYHRRFQRDPSAGDPGRATRGRIARVLLDVNDLQQGTVNWEKSRTFSGSLLLQSPGGQALPLVHLRPHRRRSTQQPTTRKLPPPMRMTQLFRSGTVAPMSFPGHREPTLRDPELEPDSLAMFLREILEEEEEEGISHQPSGRGGKCCRWWCW